MLSVTAVIATKGCDNICNECAMLTHLRIAKFCHGKKKIKGKKKKKKKNFDYF